LIFLVKRGCWESVKRPAYQLSKVIIHFETHLL
jgi:hypothetical protein